MKRMATQAQLDLAQAQLTKMLEVKTDLGKALDGTKQANQDLSDLIQANLAKLTDMELVNSNFIEHYFGIHQGVTVDPADASNYRFDENGQMETAIAISLDSWNDGSHLSLHKKGV
jgi:hypothetical protein